MGGARIDGVTTPRVFVFDASGSEDEAGAELARTLSEAGVESPFVVASVHGKRLAGSLKASEPSVAPPSTADQQWADELGAGARAAGADAVVAIGGGRCLDISKLAAARAGLTLVCVPTQLSHDGICSPVAVIPNESGRTESLGAIAPTVVFVSLPTLVDAPVDSVRAGIGDLLANPLALRDWKLAAERGLETLDERAWDLSVESFDLIEPRLEEDVERLARDPEFLRKLADALVLSGVAMIESGTSRPASGGEHEISHAIDELFGGRSMHGAQVAFGCIITTALYDDDVEDLRARLAHLGLPDHPAQLGFDEDDVIEVLLRAPQTRPGRFTVIEDADLKEPEARALVRRIWGTISR